MVRRIKCGNGNCYVVSENGNAVLIDVCKSRFFDRILHICKPYNIRLILLTHGHFDHAQNAAALSKALNAPVAMHRADAELLADNNSQPLMSGGILGKIVLNASLKSFASESIPPFVPAVLLEEGDTLMNMFYPTVSMIFRNKAQMLKSAERISSLGRRTIYFGHGKPVKNRMWVK
ncbi:MAG: MBL fold metallo-hydrolase [Ruminococcus sp.]|nr:MBL fold metallo-hydrolase [Ruminococcus sp.]